MLNMPELYAVVAYCSTNFTYAERFVTIILIGELAPLLSVLGHEVHKHHKSACDFWPDWDAVLC